MIKLAKWIGLLVLAGTCASCVSTSLYDWATEKAPRSVVIGVVGGGSDGAVVLVELNGEDRHPDGVYELPVIAGDHAQFLAQQAAPRELGTQGESELCNLKTPTSKMARLDSDRARNGWFEVDGYERINGALRRSENSRPRYFVNMEAQIEPAGDLGSFTQLSVHRQDIPGGPDVLHGTAYLPPERRATSRVLIGVAAAPLAVAVDVVTFPVQFVAAIGIAVWFAVDPPEFLKFRGSWVLAYLGFKNGRWFNAGDPEIAMLRCLFGSALASPSTFVIAAFLPLARNFPLMAARAM